MKKIIATVLAMVMALALCATAFAEPLTYFAEGTGKNDKGNGSTKTYTFVAAKDPTVKDGDTTAKGNVAYYVESDTGVKYVTVSTLGEADVVLYTDSDKKNVVMYLDKVNDPAYLVATVFTDFGDKCGQYKKPAAYTASKTYYKAEFEGKDVLYVAEDTGSESVLVNGKLVAVTKVADATKVAHAAVPTVKDGKVTGYTCSICKLAAVEAANYASIPAGAQIVGETLYYFPVSASSTTTNGTTSPKTFDAGIAMYVGMALTSVAGSAVVIGKKKEF